MFKEWGKPLGISLGDYSLAITLERIAHMGLPDI